MDTVLALLVVAAGFAAVAAALLWLRSRVRRRGLGGGLMGPIDEIYHPAAHRFRLEVQEHEQRMAPMPSAEDTFGNSAGA